LPHYGYAIDPNTGMIKLLNRQSLHSPIPAHLAVDPTGHHLVVANYIGGDFVVLPIEADGRLGSVSGEVKDTGSGPNGMPGAGAVHPIKNFGTPESSPKKGRF
jgi:6-phosphogluconolactonase